MLSGELRVGECSRVSGCGCSCALIVWATEACPMSVPRGALELSRTVVITQPACKWFCRRAVSCWMLGGELKRWLCSRRRDDLGLDGWAASASTKGRLLPRRRGDFGLGGGVTSASTERRLRSRWRASIVLSTWAVARSLHPVGWTLRRGYWAGTETFSPSLASVESRLVSSPLRRSFCVLTVFLPQL